ncbi:MAG: hypothetical protein AAF901_09335 [Bacteroidota bacterium]
MKNFEDIKAEWQNQGDTKAPENGTDKIIKKTNYIKRGQHITNAVLGITALLLITFFFYIEAYLEARAILGLALMIGGLVVRIIIEIFSIRKINQIKYDVAFEEFKQRMMRYYKTRVNTHYVMTPIILATYVIGFLILMSLFKANLSRGFYTYIQVSGLVVLVAGVILIYKQVKKELLILKGLT